MWIASMGYRLKRDPTSDYQKDWLWFGTAVNSAGDQTVDEQ